MFDAAFYYRALYDLLFFLLIITIVLNLIFGVIIDTFGALREEKQAEEEILRDSCFICGKNRVLFETKQAKIDHEADKDRKIMQDDGVNKRGILSSIGNLNPSFEEHILHEHNMWHYLYFMVYMEIKKDTEFTGPESYVRQKINENSVEWFPQGRSMSLEHGQEWGEYENAAGDGKKIGSLVVDECK